MPPEIEFAKRAHAMLMRAMARDAGSRRDFVRAECAGDAALTTRVLQLLDAADRADTFLDRPALGSVTEATVPTPDAVGNYLVVGVLGVGGMATVYEAIQEDPHRRVALKVLHQSMTRSEAYLRFRFETEALARLHHPGIAQIYEAGAAQLGAPAPSPFFAMELIPNAVPLTTYADRHALTLRERILMLASVCDAVHHGHQHGIIHRDLKPANVLVDGEGRAKVIDFGVARAARAGPDSITKVSDVRHLIGTLNYMSPEQCAASADIDSRADVYSLGVMLYELVCARLPHELTDLPVPAALHRIMHEPPRRPELPHQRSHRDLEAIILKAIQQEPDRRYEGASDLAADLRRFLNHQMVEARSPGVVDQALLFAQRNTALVAAGLAVVACVALVAALSTVFAIRLSGEIGRRRLAEQKTIVERDQARWQAYAAQIAGAVSAMETGEFVQMRSRLESAAYQARGWEWGFLSRLAARSVSTTEAHEAMIQDMAASRDWSRFASAAADGVIRLWQADSQALLATYESDSGARATSITFTADGQHLVAGDAEGAVRLLDAGDLHGAEVLSHLAAGVRSTTALPDGRIAIAGDDGAAQIWTLQPRGMIAVPDDQPGGNQGIEASPDGTMLATFNNDGRVWVRRTQDLQVLHRFEFPASVTQVRFSEDGRRLAAVGASGRVLVWSIPEGEVEHDLEATQGVGTVRSLAFSHDGSLIAAGLVHRGIVVFSLDDGHLVGNLGGHSDAVSALCFRPDDALLASASWDRTIRTWRTSEFASAGGMTTLTGHENYVLAVAFAPDGASVVSASQDGTIRTWDPDLAAPLARVRPGGGSISAVAISPGGEQFAAGCYDGVVRVVFSATGRVNAELPGHALWVASVAFDPTGARVAAGGQDKTVRVFDLASREQQLVLKGHDARVNSVAFSPDGALLASGSRDGTVRLWDARTGDERFVLSAHRADVFAVLFSHDGRHLYSGSRDQTVRVWDVETGVCTASLMGHGQYVTCLAINPDGTRLAAGSWFGEIVLFDTDTGDLIASFPAHEAAIRGIAFSPDGRWLASCGYDATIRLFDSATRKESDAARDAALTRRAAAQRLVGPMLDRAGGDPDVLLKLLAGAGVDPKTDPWIRKVVLSALAPAQPHP